MRALRHAIELDDAAATLSPVSFGYGKRRRDALTEARDAYLVAADALQESGRALRAKQAQTRARILTRYLNRAPAAYRKARRKGKTALEAFDEAKRQSSIRVLKQISPSTYLVRPIDRGSRPYVAHVERSGRANRYLIYSVSLDNRDHREVPDWINAVNVVDVFGMQIWEFENRWTSRSYGARAHAVQEAASYYGWENFDSYPQGVTAAELRRHFRFPIERMDLD